MVLLRRIIGETLRSRRRAQHRTLRDVSASANVSLGYLSEIERGHKEASSELLSSVCDALELSLTEILSEVTIEVARTEGVLAQFESVQGEPSDFRPVSVPPAQGGDDNRAADHVGRTVPFDPSAYLANPVSLDEVRARKHRDRGGDNAPEASVAA